MRVTLGDHAAQCETCRAEEFNPDLSRGKLSALTPMTCAACGTRTVHGELICQVSDAAVQRSSAALRRLQALRARHRQQRRALSRAQYYLSEGERLSHTGSWAFVPATGELHWSPEHYRIFGRDAAVESLSYHMLIEWLHPDDRTRALDAFGRTLAERVPLDLDVRTVRPSGEVRLVHIIGRPVVQRSGDLLEVVGTTIDYTEVKQVEARLRASEQRFRLLMESIPHQVWSVQPDGNGGYFNQRLLHYTGLSADEFEADAWRTLHPEDVPKVQEAWRSAWAGAPFDVEARMRRSDGVYRRFVCRAVPVRDAEGRIVEWLGTNTDVEDERAMQEGLTEAQAARAQMSRLTTMGELAATLSHELNQPLAAIVSSGGAALRWLERGQPNVPEAKDALQAVVRDALRAGQVIARVRQFLGRSSETPAPVALAQVVEDAAGLLKHELAKHTVQLSVELPEAVPHVAGSSVELQQVLLNLVLNAVEAMAATDIAKRRLTIKVYERPCDGGPGVALSVSDCGSGLAGRSAERLFQPFYTTKAHGLGMGLAISRSIIANHGGVLTVTGNADGGATFELILPAVRELHPETG